MIVLCMLVSTVMCNAYPLFREQANAKMEKLKAEQTQTEPVDDLFVADSDFIRYLMSSIYYMNYEITPNMNAYEYFTQNYDMSRLGDEEQANVQEASARLMKNMRNQYTTVEGLNNYGSYVVGVDRSFGTDIGLKEAITGNMGYSQEYFSSGIIISFDSRGIPSIRESWNMDYDKTELLGYLRHTNMNRLMEDNGMYGYDATETVYEEAYDEITVPDEATAAEEAPVMEAAESAYIGNAETLKLIPLPLIQNVTFAFGVHKDAIQGDAYWDNYYLERNAYNACGYKVGVFGIILVMAVLALILQNVPALELRKSRLFCLPTELVAFIGCTGLGFTFTYFINDFGRYTMSSEIVEDCELFGFSGASAYAATALVWVFWAVFAFCCYWLTASVLPYITHPIKSLKEYLLVSSIFRWCKKQWLRLWHWGTDIELDENLTRNIWKLVAVNGVVVGLLCCIWFGGVVGSVIYSVILYVLVKKKCAQIQENYQSLLCVTKRIADGDLSTEITEDMGLLNPVREELVSIQSGFRKAVNEEVRSRNMKTELITNVSHDLKTPLTAIITYVDLLKKEDISEEERKEYIETLDRKSQRLKVLIEDLFEVSKATTNNVTMNYDDVDLVNLIKQVRLENEDKIAESTLDIRWNLPEVKCILTLDPQKTYRIVDNLLQNILKYSMPHSRVYIELKAVEGEVLVSFKNMSAAEMNFSAEEITERFVRGDLSRNTEGSGLGLAIAQSFTELQNGTFKVEIDGDLFKVTLGWPKNK